MDIEPRDYFAGLVLQALIAKVSERDTTANIAKLPTTAYQLADMMMQARKCS